MFSKRLFTQGRLKLGYGKKLSLQVLLHSYRILKSFPKRQISDAPKLKDIAHDNSRFFENGRMFSERVENTVGKGETVHYEQFLLFPQCFKTCTGDKKKTRTCLGKG